MNKIILTTLVCLLSFNFASAQVHPSSNSDVKDVKPYYTTVENLFSLEIGMTYDEVRSVLNAPVGMGYMFTSDSVKAKFLKPLIKFLESNHPYECPSIIALPTYETNNTCR